MIGKAIAAGVFGLLALTMFGGSFYNVDEGDRAVLLRNGQLVGTAQPGLGFKMPLIDSAIDISVREHIREFGNTAESPPMAAYTFDTQTALVRVSVNYRIPTDKVEEVYKRFRGEQGLVSTILDPKTYRAVKDEYGKVTAVKAIQSRELLTAAILTHLQELVNGEPIIVTAVQLENIDYSDGFESAVARQIEAEVEVRTLRQNAEREKVQAQITVTKAQATADSTLANAKADAQSTVLRGEAEASAIRAKGSALRDNPSLVSLVQAEKWNGTLPTTMIPSSTVPFMNMGAPAN